MFRRAFAFLIAGSGLLLWAHAGKADDLVVEALPKPQKAAPHGSSCCDSNVQRIVVECPTPEIVFQRAGGICPPEQKGFFQKCGHFRFHQWTHASGHSHGPVSGIPMVFAPQQQATPQSFIMPQSFVQPQSFVMPQSASFSVSPQSFVMPQSASLSVAPQSFVMPQSATFNVAPQSFSVAPQSFVMPQSFNVAPQSFSVSPQSFVIQQPNVSPQSGSVQPQAGSTDGSLEIREAVRQLSDNLKKASELIKMQTEVLVKHDNRIFLLEANSNAVFDAINNGKKLEKDKDGKFTAK